MQKIILYYKFCPINDTEAVRLWQTSLASSLGLKGRIILADHGINGTLGGEISDLKQYVKQTKTYSGFKNIEFKWSDGSSDNFPRLSVKVRPELVSFNTKKLEVNDKGIVGGGKRLSPAGLHQLINQKNKEVVLIDGRNSREAAIGKFKDAIVLDVNHTRDMPHEIANPKYETLKDKTVVTYCTGGIRCEVLTKLMIDEGYKDVYQLDGGIVRYLDTYKDDGLWEGSLFVFDDRMSIDASEHTKVIGSCNICKAKTKEYINCANKACNELILACSNCQTQTSLCFKCNLVSV